MNRDRYGPPLTAASERAAGHYRDGVDRPAPWPYRRHSVCNPSR
jgi:hypothetical protein